MDLGSIFLILALLVFVGLFVGRPFMERRVEHAYTAGGEEHLESALLAERDRLLNALQELDFDNALGKIPAEDYPVQRAFLLQRGADVLRKLDNLHPGGAEENAEARLEAAIAARRADTSRATQRARMPAVAAGATPDDQLETMLANRRRERQEKAGGFCPKCGSPVMKSDKFCSGCGSTL